MSEKTIINPVANAVADLGYGYARSLDLPVDAAIAEVTEKLKAEGFGVLFQLDLQEKLREKLGVAFRDYAILGACNPAFAYQSLQEEVGLGLLLPCNVIVYEEDGKAVVAVIDAAKMLAVVGNPKLQVMAAQVNEKLRRVLDSL